MFRIMGRRVSPTLFPTSPTNERESTWDELREEGIKIQQRMDESLQRAMDLCSSYLSKKHGVSRSKAAKDLHDGIGREGDGLVDNKPVGDNIVDEVHASSETEILQGEEDIPIHIAQSVQESSQGACDEWIHNGLVCATIVDEGFVEDIGVEPTDLRTEYEHMHKDLDHGSSLTATDQLDVLRGQQMRATPMFQNSPLQGYIDRACGTLSSQWYSGEVVRYEDEGVASSRLCVQDQQQFGFGSSRLVSAAAGAGVARLQQQVGLFYRYTWDPGTSWLDNWTVGSTGRLHEAPRAGVLQSSRGCSWHSIVRRIVWDPGILQKSIPSTEGYRLSRLTWDPGISIGSVGSCLELFCNCLRTSNLAREDL